MDTANSNKALVLKYFNSWQVQDFAALRESLDDNVEFDMNGSIIKGADMFVEICKNGINWEKVDLLDSIFTDDKSALIYDGLTAKGEKVRVGEIVSVANGKIVKAVAAIVGNA